jgi:hypothetical protein
MEQREKEESPLVQTLFQSLCLGLSVSVSVSPSLSPLPPLLILLAYHEMLSSALPCPSTMMD